MSTGTVQAGGDSVMVWNVCSWRDMRLLVHLDTTRTALTDSWCQLPPTLFQMLIESMQRRLAALLRERVVPIQYYAGLPVVLALQCNMKYTL
ncbi:hypothetical protein TNCV_4753021 [Trichonephila clavipes]|nr:hypothetical protein TNCV_4753021 [Trichonephila clavipes]